MARKVTVALPDGTTASRRTPRHYEFAIVARRFGTWELQEDKSYVVAPIEPKWEAVAYSRTLRLAEKALITAMDRFGSLYDGFQISPVQQPETGK